MDQIKIGKFISLRRKAKGLTQVQLAEQLGITDRAVSKWENGNSLPDASIMLELCNLLDINVNELLTGERISQEDYQRKAESNMIEIIKDKTKSKEEKIITHALTIAIVIIALAGGIIPKFFETPEAAVSAAIVSFVSLICIVGVWIVTTVSLRNWKNK